MHNVQEIKSKDIEALKNGVRMVFLPCAVRRIWMQDLCTKHANKHVFILRVRI